MTLGKLGRVRHPERVVRVWGRRCNFEGPTEVGWLVLGSAEEVRIGELLNRYLDRRARGESITEDLITAEHPDLAGELLLHLNMLKAIEPPELTIRQLVGKKILAPATSSDWSAELGPYRITGVIGRGGMGIVLRAHDPSLGRPVALMLLRPELAVDRRALVRFEHEAKAAAALRHPNIVTIHACGECDGSRYLAMELIDGPSLADLLAQGSELPTEEIRRIFHELLEALTAAHSAGLIHRDIKSSNILLDGSERRAKIADFGLARISSAQTRITMPQAAVGTPEYMSPEQARGDEDIDHRTDLYSAGVVLYEMLTGRVPFRADTSSAVIHAILNVEPPSPRSLRKSADPRLSDLALRLMAKRREDRFGSAGETMAALAGKRKIRLPGWGLRRIPWMARAIAGMIALGAITFWLATSLRPTPRLVASAAIVKVGDQCTDAIRVEYTDSPEPQHLRPFPGSGSVINQAVRVGRGRWTSPVIVASVTPPIDGQLLFALDGTGNILWSREYFSPWLWPDCAVARDFHGLALVAGDLDGRPGDEIVFVASDEHEYPTAIVVLDSRNGQERARYWHAGDIEQVVLAPDLLGPGRPAIVAVGVNNKLDGFDEPDAGDDKPVARFEWVPVVMVLDYSTTSGERILSVPSIGHRLPGRETVLPHSYAFLDVARNPEEQRVGGSHGPRLAPPREDLISIREATIGRSHTDREGETIIQLHMATPGQPQAGPILELNERLQLRKITPSLTTTVGRTREYWDERYHVIVRDGEIVPEYRAGYPRDPSSAESD